MSLNQVVMIGNLTRDPELKYTEAGVPYASAGIAVQRDYKNAAGEREADFFNIVAWRQTAEFLAQYGAKGKKVAITGQLQSRKYQAQDGTNKTVIDIKVNNIQLLSPPNGQGAGQEDAGLPPDPGEDFSDPFAE